MKQYVQQARIKLLTLVMAGIAGAGLSVAASAAETGAGINAHVGTGASASMPDTAQAGGSAETHMSTAGSANSNAQWMSGATRGADRAAARMDAHGVDSGATGTASVTGKR